MECMDLNVICEEYENFRTIDDVDERLEKGLLIDFGSDS